MTNQLDLVTVVRNMLADVREKTTQLADAQTALELSRARLVSSQKDLGDHIKTVNDLATEINSELSFANLEEVKEETVADSLKVTKSAEDETLAEDVAPAKIAASDESPTSEVELTITGSKGGPGLKVNDKLAPISDGKAESEFDEDDDDEAVEPAPKAVAKAASSSTKASAPEKKTPEKKAPVVSSGLWDDDDEEVF